ncbi:MAG: S-layer homology domain-containing protein, partial [Clostridia bacterium]|nr:S-layer homology domain-containing protein [Clostridia bacterium]
DNTNIMAALVGDKADAGTVEYYFSWDEEHGLNLAVRCKPIETPHQEFDIDGVAEAAGSHDPDAFMFQLGMTVELAKVTKWTTKKDGRVIPDMNSKENEFYRSFTRRTNDGTYIIGRWGQDGAPAEDAAGRMRNYADASDVSFNDEGTQTQTYTSAPDNLVISYSDDGYVTYEVSFPFEWFLDGGQLTDGLPTAGEKTYMNVSNMAGGAGNGRGGDFATYGVGLGDSGYLSIWAKMTSKQSPNCCVGTFSDGYLTDKKPGHEHSYDDVVVTPPTCTEKGYTTHTCRCGDSYADTYVDAKGHDFAAEWTVDVQPTVDHVGTESRHCSRCSEVTDSRIVKKLLKPLIDTSKLFKDVSAKGWYKEAVDYAYTYGLMNGMSADTFVPNGTMTRSMLVTVLWRLEGEPASSVTVPFTDLKQDWYKPAVAWAYENRIVNGTSADKFSPNGSITREQMAAILFRYSQFKEYDTSASASLAKFPDQSKVHDYAIEPIKWAVGEEIIGGVAKDGKSYLDPRGSATRAQVATILERFCLTH